MFTLLFAGHEGKSWKLGVFPLFMAGHDADGGWRTGVFPLFWASRSKDHATLATLIGGYSLTPGGKRLYVGPFYYRNDAETTSGALFPIAYFGKNHTSGGSTSFILPLYLDIRRSEDRQLAAYSPLVWRYHSVRRRRSSACRSSSTSTATASRAPRACCRCSFATARTWIRPAATRSRRS